MKFLVCKNPKIAGQKLAAQQLFKYLQDFLRKIEMLLLGYYIKFKYPKYQKSEIGIINSLLYYFAALGLLLLSEF